MSSDPNVERKSGKTQAEEVTEEVAEEALELVTEEPDLPGLEDPQWPQFQRGNTGFTRMRVGMNPEDREFFESIRQEIDRLVLHEFADAYGIMSDLFDVVRTPMVNEDGEPTLDQYGNVVWARHLNGMHDEDWSRLSHSQREHFLFLITTRLFSWEQTAIDLWSQAMMVKAQWEERFADSYLIPEKTSVDGKTVESRTSYAKREVAEDRYLAIFETTISRRADAIVRTMTLLGQRLKDTIT